MIPLPRPAVPYGACQDCGRRHDGECQLAESERNRETPEPIEVTSGGYGYRQGGKDYALPPPTWRKLNEWVDGSE